MQDSSIHWMRKRIFIPPFQMQGIGMHAAADVVLHSIETIAAEYGEVTAVGMGTTQLADGEFLNGYIPCPYDLDPKFPVGFSIWWTADHDGTGALTSSWILLQDSIEIGTAIALPATTLNTIIPLLSAYNDALGVTTVTDFRIQKTGRGIRDDIGLTRIQIENGGFLTFKIEMDAALNETSIRFVGLEMDYALQMTTGAGSHLDTPLISSQV